MPRLTSVFSSLSFVPALLLLASMSGSCAPPEASPLAVHVEWGLTDPSATLPSNVERLRVLVEIEGEEMVQESIHTVSGLEDADDNGRPELDRDALPPGVPIRMTIEGQDGAGRTLYVGHVGPIVLQHGERRHVDLRMYELGTTNLLDSAPLTPRLLHSATTLADGRVLIAGGFSGVTPNPCPGDVADPDARCYGLTATASAGILDVNTGRVLSLSPMLGERGGHTATVLADGRVLLAGGSETAIVVFEHQDGGFSIDLRPGFGGDTFEIFDPEANPEREDIDRDGDPGRGGFLGAADDDEEPGRLDTPRTLHAATLLADGRVLLAGGVTSAGSYTIFDPQRAGGYGVIGTGTLENSRGMPGAASTGSGSSERAWILGGANAASNDDLAEIWTAGTAAMPLGSTAPATDDGFPDASMTARPEFGLIRPLVATVGEGSHVLAVGWLGPHCATGGAPDFVPTNPLCGYDLAELRSYTINASTGVATPTGVRNAHAFGAIAVLDDGRVAVTGGMTGLTFQAGNTVDVYSGAVSGGIAALSDERPLLLRGRAMHSTSATPGGGLVSFGGVAPSTDLSALTLVTGLEVQYLQ